MSATWVTRSSRTKLSIDVTRASIAAKALSALSFRLFSLLTFFSRICGTRSHLVNHPSRLTLERRALLRPITLMLTWLLGTENVLELSAWTSAPPVRRPSSAAHATQLPCLPSPGSAGQLSNSRPRLDCLEIKMSTSCSSCRERVGGQGKLQSRPRISGPTLT